MLRCLCRLIGTVRLLLAKDTVSAQARLLSQWEKGWGEGPRVLAREERAQVAVLFLLVTLGVFALFGLSFDTGVWYLDHRTAQSQAEAAALAAAEQLPATDITAATAAANASLADNHAADDKSCLVFSSAAGTTTYDTVKVCVRRDASGIFSSLANIDFATVSASATARAGPAVGSNVMPLAVVPPDPTCGPTAGRNCLFDANGNGSYADPGDCNAPFSVCPWGLTASYLYTFKSGGGGDTGATRVCPSGTSGYVSCMSGAILSDPVTAGSSIDVKPGNLGSNTVSSIQDRDPLHPLAYVSSGGASCDVQSLPSAPKTGGANDLGGYDPVGSANAKQAYVTNPTYADCRYRIVVIPVLNAYPTHGEATETVLGLATFALTSWNRSGGSSQDVYGNSTQACGAASSSSTNFDCGAMWGYFMPGATAPDFQLERIGTDQNPFAPILVAVTQ